MLKRFDFLDMRQCRHLLPASVVLPRAPCSHADANPSPVTSLPREREGDLEWVFFQDMVFSLLSRSKLFWRNLGVEKKPTCDVAHSAIYITFLLTIKFSISCL